MEAGLPAALLVRVFRSAGHLVVKSLVAESLSLSRFPLERLFALVRASLGPPLRESIP